MLLEATITPLTSLPTAHPSPEAVRTTAAAARRPGPHAGDRFTSAATRATATAVSETRRR